MDRRVLREGLKRGHWPTLLCAFLHFDISFMVWVILGALMPFIASDPAFGTMTASVKLTLVAIPLLSAAFWRLLIGGLVDRYGSRRIGILSLAVTLLPLAVGWRLGNSYGSLVFVGVFLGLAGASFAIALPLASRWYPPELQGLVMGIAGAGNSGTVLATLFAPMLARLYGWHAVMGLMMIPVTLTLLLFALLAKDPPARGRPAGLAEYMAVLRTPDAWWFCLLYFVTFGGFVGLSSFFNTFFVDQYGIPKESVGLWTWPFILAGSFLRPLGGALADRLGGIRMLTLLYTIAAITSAGVGLVIGHFALACGLLFVLMGCLGMGNGSVFQLVPQRFRAQIGAMTGLVGAAGGVGGYYLNTALGFLHDLTGSYAAGFFAFTAVAAMALVALHAVAPAWTGSWLGDGGTALAAYGVGICPYCGVGCRVWVEADDNRLIRVNGVADAPANRGRLCPKGGHLWRVVDTPDRLTAPQLRRPGTTEFHPVSWDVALETATGALKVLIEHYGPESVAFYGSGQLDTEAVYLAVKLFKGFLGTNNTDSNSRLCMASAVAGYVSSLGADGPPTCYDDVDHATCILVLGANMADAHPVIWDRVRAAKKARPDLTIVVVDPRRTRTAEGADLHVPLQPGSDLAFLNGVARVLIDRGHVDSGFVERHTTGCDAFTAFLAGIDVAECASICGLEPGVIEASAQRIGEARRFLSFYSMGANQSTVGVWKNNSIINLHLLTGQIGRPGAGPFSLTGQPNAMGGREAGLLSHALPGYRTVTDPGHRAEVERYWGLPAGSIRSTPGYSAVELFRALETGKVKAVWIAATNPAVSLPDLHQARRALERAELVIVQDPYHPTETSRYAHILLPVAQFSEKEGTSTNSERMVSFSEQIVAPPGVARPDWEILAEVGQRLGFPGFEFTSAAEVWDEFRQLTTGRPCDLAGITAARLRRERHLQWPCPTETHPGTPRIYQDRCFPTPDGRARFLARPHMPPREGPDTEFPLLLTTGRISSQWHTRTRTGKVRQLVRADPEPFLEIHPDDAAARGIADGEIVSVTSRRGCLKVRARVTDRIAPGVTFIAMHWGDLFDSGTAVNYLTLSALDPVSLEPEFKCCAVAVENCFSPPLHEIALPWPRKGSSWLLAPGSRAGHQEPRALELRAKAQQPWTSSRKSKSNT
jgi:ferredoxin-nitrate reductase